MKRESRERGRPRPRGCLMWQAGGRAAPPRHLPMRGAELGPFRAQAASQGLARQFTTPVSHLTHLQTTHGFSTYKGLP